MSATENMLIIETTELDPAQKEGVYRLWNSEYPERLRHASLMELDRYLHGLENKHHLLLTGEGQKILGWCFSFERDGDTWFAIIINGRSQGEGYGKLLLNALKKKHTFLNGWVIDHHHDKKPDGQPYRSPLPFYLANGFKTEPGTRLETKKISAVKMMWQL